MKTTQSDVLRLLFLQRPNLTNLKQRCHLWSRGDSESDFPDPKTTPDMLLSTQTGVFFCCGPGGLCWLGSCAIVWGWGILDKIPLPASSPSHILMHLHRSSMDIQWSVLKIHELCTYAFPWTPHGDSWITHAHPWEGDRLECSRRPDWVRAGIMWSMFFAFSSKLFEHCWSQ